VNKKALALQELCNECDSIASIALCTWVYTSLQPWANNACGSARSTTPHPRNPLGWSSPRNGVLIQLSRFYHCIPQWIGYERW